ncbi:MAG TPA: rRNA adenine N-6-methyltransferase family protein, partial [Chloroflexota bacterium]|nr:rRNA adenine N-6-methyltransferase family protein [Chloroflexota bacterium]
MIRRSAAKKSLGQHFLVDREVLADIVDALEVVPGDRVLEIGPGHGVLTRALLDAGAS